MRKSYGKIWKWCTTERTSWAYKYYLFRVSHMIFDNAKWFLFYCLLFFGFVLFFSFFFPFHIRIYFILFHFNRFELCGNAEEWLIFHYRNTILFLFFSFLVLLCHKNNVIHVWIVFQLNIAYTYSPVREIGIGREQGQTILFSYCEIRVVWTRPRCQST